MLCNVVLFLFDYRLFDNKITKDGVKRLKEFSKTRTNLDIKVCF